MHSNPIGLRAFLTPCRGKDILQNRVQICAVRLSSQLRKSFKRMGNPRRGFPTEKQSTGLLFAPPAPFRQRDFAVCGLQGGASPLHPTAFKKKRAKTFRYFAELCCGNRVFLCAAVKISLLFTVYLLYCIHSNRDLLKKERGFSWQKKC